MKKSLQVRELYCPSHFGNTYEVALDSEMMEILSEAKFWGFNRFSDWFDTIDLYDVYQKKHSWFNLPEAMWARKFQNYQIAQGLGLELGLVITPNHIFSDQITPANEAVKSGHYFGQLACPSKPGVIERIVKNYRNLFRDFASRGLPIRSISACPYDYGGCGCEACRPWIVTFGKLFREIVRVARQYFSQVDADLIGWWWSDDDHREFTAWADRKAKGLFNSMAFYLPYGATDYTVRPIPKDCHERAFVHIGYGENEGSDQYGHYGPTIAPERLEKTVNYLFSRKAQGVIAYSEGEFDDINKALLAGLSSGKFRNADEVLKAYAKRYLYGDAEGWTAWLRQMGEFSGINAIQARKEFDQLKKRARSSWRLAQLEDRLIMAESHTVVESRKKWDRKRLDAAGRYWSAKEHLFRHLWRLGLLRHIFRFDYIAPQWNREYQKVLGNFRETSSLKKCKEA
jgi:hypothetical protein